MKPPSTVEAKVAEELRNWLSSELEQLDAPNTNQFAHHVVTILLHEDLDIEDEPLSNGDDILRDIYNIRRGKTRDKQKKAAVQFLRSTVCCNDPVEAELQGVVDQLMVKIEETKVKLSSPRKASVNSCHQPTVKNSSNDRERLYNEAFPSLHSNNKNNSSLICHRLGPTGTESSWDTSRNTQQLEVSEKSVSPEEAHACVTARQVFLSALPEAVFPPSEVLSMEEMDSSELNPFSQAYNCWWVESAFQACTLLKTFVPSPFPLLQSVDHSDARSRRLPEFSSAVIPVINQSDLRSVHLDPSYEKTLTEHPQLFRPIKERCNCVSSPQSDTDIEVNNIFQVSLHSHKLRTKARIDKHNNSPFDGGGLDGFNTAGLPCSIEGTLDDDGLSDSVLCFLIDGDRNSDKAVGIVRNDETGQIRDDKAGEIRDDKEGEMRDDKAGEMRDKAGEIRDKAGEIRDTTGEMRDTIGEIRDKAGEMRDDKAGEMRDTTGEMRDDKAGEIRDKAGEMRDDDKIGEMRDDKTGQIRDKIHMIRDKTGEIGEGINKLRDGRTDKVREVNTFCGLPYAETMERLRRCRLENGEGDIKSTLHEGDVKSTLHEGDVKSTLHEGNVKSTLHEGNVKSTLHEGDVKSTLHEGDVKSTLHEGDVKSTLHEGDVKSTLHEGDVKSTLHEGDVKSTLHEGDIKSTLHEGDVKSTLHEGDVKSTLHEGDVKSTLHESDVKSTLHEGDVKSTLHEGDVKSTLHEGDVKSTLHEGDVKSTLHEGDVKSTLHEGDVKSTLHEGDVKSTLHEGNVKSTLHEGDVKSTLHEGDVKSTLHEGDVKSTLHEGDVKSTLHEGDVKSITYEGVVKSISHEEDVKSTSHKWDVKSITHEGHVKSISHEEDVKSTPHEGDVKSISHKGNVKSISHEGDVKSISQRLLFLSKETSDACPSEIDDIRSFPHHHGAFWEDVADAGSLTLYPALGDQLMFELNDRFEPPQLANVLPACHTQQKTDSTYDSAGYRFLESRLGHCCAQALPDVVHGQWMLERARVQVQCYYALQQKVHVGLQNPFMPSLLSSCLSHEDSQFLQKAFVNSYFCDLLGTGPAATTKRETVAGVTCSDLERCWLSTQRLDWLSTQRLDVGDVCATSDKVIPGCTCSSWLENDCHLGDECPFSHPSI